MKKILQRLAITVLLAVALLFCATPGVFAQSDTGGYLAQTTQKTTTTSQATIGSDVCTGNDCKLPNPLGEIKDVRVLVGQILRGLFGLLGTVALILFIWGGFQMMISRGDSKKIANARDTMVWAAIGLGVIFGSYSIAEYVLRVLTQDVAK